MPFLADVVLENGLSHLTANGTRLDLCSQEPTTYAEATSTYSLGDSTVTVGAAEDGDVSGRKVVVPATSGQTVDASGTATHWALADGTSVLLATNALSASQVVTSGNTFNSAAFDITLPDAVSE